PWSPPGPASGSRPPPATPRALAPRPHRPGLRRHTASVSPPSSHQAFSSAPPNRVHPDARSGKAGRERENAKERKREGEQNYENSGPFPIITTPSFRFTLA